MKTSFYFVLWILIYPILGLLNNSFIDNHAFIIALAIVWGVSWLFNLFMPDTLTYERALQMTPVLEDVYSGNVNSFKTRLSTDVNIEVITTIYFVLTTMVIALAIFMAGVNDWIALVIFGFFTIGAISRSAKLIKAKSHLASNPTPEQCMEIADEIYKLDYASYYEARSAGSYSEILPPAPRNFKIFRIVSLFFASASTLLGILYIILAILIMTSQSSFESNAVAGMYFLYGSLAAYFGVKDFNSSWRCQRNYLSESSIVSVK